jgi:glycosyltransferase involved in cell wall biosynthesis
MKLSIIIPVYNEEKTIAKVLNRVNVLSIPNVSKEVHVIDDGSTDGTPRKIREFIKKFPDVIQHHVHDRNKGKGAAVRTGIRHAKGHYIIIQDADLEYNPENIVDLVKAIKNPKVDVIFGTRLNRMPHLKEEERTFRFFLHYWGNKFLSLVTSVLYGKWITDMETCYKLFPRKLVKNMTLQARGFELEPELTAKLMKMKVRYVEIPITTTPRGYAEGKKLNTFQDGFKAVWTLMKYRVVK